MSKKIEKKREEIHEGKYHGLWVDVQKALGYSNTVTIQSHCKPGSKIKRATKRIVDKAHELVIDWKSNQ